MDVAQDISKDSITKVIVIMAYARLILERDKELQRFIIETEDSSTLVKMSSKLSRVSIGLA